MDKLDWSPSPQDGYIEHLERELMKRSGVGPVQVIDAKTGNALKVITITQTPVGTVIEVE